VTPGLHAGVPERPAPDALPGPVADIRCRTCTSPDREAIEQLLLAGYSPARTREYLLARGASVPTGSSLKRHRRGHLLAPDDPAAVVRMAVAQGSRQLKSGKVRLNGSTLVAFVRLQREIAAGSRARVSEELAARCVNVVLTTMRRHVDPETFHAIKDEAWPQLMQLVSDDPDALADAAPAPGPGASQRHPPPAAS
jgi:hypothetical protein